MDAQRTDEEVRTPGAVLCWIGLALCLVSRDMPQFLALQAYSGNHLAQYGTAFGRALVLAAFIAAVLVCKKRGNSHSSLSSLSICIGMLVAASAQAVGLLLLVLSESDLRTACGALLLGCGQSGLIILWAMWFLRFTPRETLQALLVGCLVAGCLEMMFSAMNTIAALGISFAVPFASCLLARLAVEQGAFPKSTKAYEHGRRGTFEKNAVLCLTALFFCSLTIRQLTDSWMASGNQEGLFLFVLCGGIGTMLTALLALAALKMGRRLRTEGAFLLLAVPFVVLAAYTSNYLDGVLSALYVIPLFAMRKFLLLASLLFAACYRSERDRRLAFFAAMLCVEFGNLAQTMASRLLALTGASSEVTTALLIAISLVMLCTAPIVIILTAKTGDNRKPEPIEKMSATARETALDKMKEDYKLTAREREVLGYLNAGRNADYIAKTLYIAHSTAKSHISHIYQKTGLNSQQRLMDEVERRTKDLDEEEE